MCSLAIDKMISIKDRRALTRHEVVGLLEEAIHSTEQYWGNCYLVDQLSMLAYRIANGEAGFVEDEEEVIMGGHNSSDAETGIIETMLDGYEAMTEGWISRSHFRSAVSELSNDEVIEVIGLAWFYRAGWLEEEARRGAERSEEYRTYSHTVVDGSGIRCGNCPIYNKALITLPRDKPARTHMPKGDNLEIDTEMLKDKVEAIMRNRVRQKPKPKPEETKNTTETITEGLEKGLLALNLIAELYSKKRGKA